MSARAVTPPAEARELVRAQSPAGEHANEPATGAEPILRIDGTRQLRQELGGRAAEHVDPEHVVPGCERLSAHGVGADADEAGVDAQPFGRTEGTQTQGLNRR